MIFLIMGRSAENIKEKKKIEEKHWKVKRKKNEEYKEGQVTTKYIFGFKLYFARINIWIYNIYTCMLEFTFLREDLID